MVNISDHVVKIKQEVEAELFGEDSSRCHVDTKVSICSKKDMHFPSLLRFNRNSLYDMFLDCPLIIVDY